MDYFEVLQLPVKVQLSQAEIDVNFRKMVLAASKIGSAEERSERLQLINTGRQLISNVRERIKLVLERSGVRISQEASQVPQEILYSSFAEREKAENLLGEALQSFVQALQIQTQHTLQNLDDLLDDNSTKADELIALYYRFVYASKLLEDLDKH